MNRNRYLASLMIVLPLLLALAKPGGALCESTAKRKLSLSGTVVAGQAVPVFAAYGGRVESSGSGRGAYVAEGDMLYTLGVTTLYSPIDGTVGLVGAAPGADASYISSRYGALAAIEPGTPITISADTTNAYNSPSTLAVHVGETVYAASRNTSGISGTGVVVSADGKKYTVEMRDGNIPVGEGVAVFRDASRSTDSKLGNGTASRAANALLTGEGTIAAVHVAQGQQVSRGDPLIDLVGGKPSAAGEVSLDAVAPYAGILTEALASAGDTVQQGQLIARLCPQESLRVSVLIPEADVQHVSAGDIVTVEIDNLPAFGTISATVESISGMASGTGEDTAYEALIELDTAHQLRIGLRATVMIN